MSGVGGAPPSLFYGRVVTPEEYFVEAKKWATRNEGKHRSFLRTWLVVDPALSLPPSPEEQAPAGPLGVSSEGEDSSSPTHLEEWTLLFDRPAVLSPLPSKFPHLLPLRQDPVRNPLLVVQCLEALRARLLEAVSPFPVLYLLQEE